MSAHPERRIVKLWCDVPHDGVQYMRAQLTCGHLVFFKVPAAMGCVVDSLPCDQCTPLPKEDEVT